MFGRRGRRHVANDGTPPPGRRPFLPWFARSICPLRAIAARMGKRGPACLGDRTSQPTALLADCQLVNLMRSLAGSGYPANYGAGRAELSVLSGELPARRHRRAQVSSV
jgi:hypothetical protein